MHDAAALHSPILLVTSAEANSGKTQLLSLIGFLVPRALVCVEISEATLFRGIEKWLPTIIVDEADVILINNEPLRSVVNSWLDARLLRPALHRRRQYPARFSDVLSESDRHEGQKAAGHNAEPLHHYRNAAKEGGRTSHTFPFPRRPRPC